MNNDFKYAAKEQLKGLHFFRTTAVNLLWLLILLLRFWKYRMAQTISEMRIHRDIVAVITTTVSLVASAALVSVWTAVLSAGVGTHVITSENINFTVYEQSFSFLTHTWI